jgi:hypothetical protein
MTRDQAKEILSTGRAGALAGTDAVWLEAIQLAERDAVLREWWAGRQRFNSEVSAAFRRIEVPPDLAQRILAGRPGKIVPFPGVQRRWWAAAIAAIAAILVLGGWLWWVGLPRGPQFQDFRHRMARAALRDYRMDIQTNDLRAIRQYLEGHRAPAGYELSPRLEALPGLGCGVLRWQDQPVSMVCFDLGAGQVLWLFVAERTAVAGAPGRPQPAFEPVGRLATAAWSTGRHVYLLMSVGTADLLKQFL